MTKGMSYISRVTSGDGSVSHAGDWKIVGLTEKTIKLEMIVRPKTIWGEYGLARDAKVGDVVLVKRDSSGRHAVRDWGDGTFTIYANRDGTPHSFEPMTSN